MKLAANTRSRKSLRGIVPPQVPRPPQADDAARFAVEHLHNERRLIHWTIWLVWGTVALVVIGAVANVLVYLSLVDARVLSSQQSTDTQHALAIAQQSADSAARQAEAANTAAETAQRSLVLTQRAWVGPTTAIMSNRPAVGQELLVIISYQNTGNVPATDLSSSVAGEIVTPTTDIAAVISSGSEACASIVEPQGGVAFPSSGFGNSYNISQKFDGARITERVLDGRDMLVVYGCFAYRTLGEVHHSAFCYYFDAKITKENNLNICAVGQRAD